MRKAKIFIINGIVLTSSSLLIRGVGLVFSIYVANKVGQETIGIFSLAMSIYNFAITFATSGMSLACTYIVSEEFAKKNFEKGFKSVKNCITFATTLGITASILLIFLAPLISSTWLNKKISNIPIYSIAIGLPLISISSVISGYLTSVGKSYKSAISQCIELLIKILATYILLKISINKGIDAICTSLILGDVISELFSFGLNITFYFVDKKKRKLSRSYNTEINNKILKIALPVAITSYIRSGLSSLKQFLIPFRLQASGLNYSLAISKYGLINGMVMPVLLFCSFFINSFSGLLVPEYSRLLAGKNFNRMKSVCYKIFAITFSFSFLIAGVFLFFSNEVSLLVYKNLEIAIYLKIFSFLIIFMYIDNIIDGILKGINSQFGVMIINICDLLITICIIYFIVPIYGINGYVFSIFISEIFNFTASFILLKKKLIINFDFLNFCIKPFIICLFSYFITMFLPINFQNIQANYILKISTFTILYLLIFAKINYNFLKSL